MNPLFKLFGQNQNGGNYPSNMLQEFNRFRSTFQGDPQQQVQELLNSGRMSQEQFAQLSSMAREFEQLLK